MTSEIYFGVSLRLHHPTTSPTDISNVLGRPAEFVGVKGTQRGSSRGLPAATWLENYWCSEFEDGESVEERIRSVVDFLRQKNAEVSLLLQTGGRADVYVFLAPVREFGVELDVHTLASLAHANVSLGFDVLPSVRTNQREDGA